MMERVDIEALVEWAYRAQCVDRVCRQIDQSGLVGPRVRSGTDALVSVAQLGVRVDASPGYVAAMGATVQDDALAIHDAVLSLPAEAMVLVITHGRAGSRPAWHGLEAERLVPLTDQKGRLRMMAENKKNVGCRLTYAVDPALVAFSRAQYGVWWEALSALADALSGQLERHAPLFPAAPREPWLLPPLVHVDEPDWMALDSSQNN